MRGVVCCCGVLGGSKRLLNFFGCFCCCFVGGDSCYLFRIGSV